MDGKADKTDKTGFRNDDGTIKGWTEDGREMTVGDLAGRDGRVWLEIRPNRFLDAESLREVADLLDKADKVRRHF